MTAPARPGAVGAPVATTAVLVSAALFFLGTGFAGQPVFALTWLAPLPVLLLATRVGVPATLGAAVAAAFLGTANSWSFFLSSTDVPLWAGALISVALSGMFAAAAGVFAAVLHRGRPLLAATGAAATWTGLAYLVQQVNPMGLIGTFANDQADAPLVLQMASVTGPWGVEFLVLFVPAAVAALAAPGADRGARQRAAAVGVAVLLLALGFGAVRLTTATPGPVQGVALIAHNRAGWGVDVAAPAGRDLLAGYVDRIAALPAGVRTAVLPEGAFTVDDTTLPDLVDPLREVAGERGIDVVVGYTRLAGGAKLATALTVPAAGGPPVAYLKHHDRVSPPADDLALPPVGGAPTGIAICGDLDFADPARSYARAGATLLAVPASDNDGNGWVHSRLAALRAAENGTAVLWAARRGQPAVVDGYGRVLAETRTGGDAGFSTVVAELPAGPGATPYTRLGDWFAWLCLAGTVAALAAGVRPAARTGR
jgi:apolipoprotein N-acyltransferase